MPKNHSIVASHYAFTQNREISWLHFNQRGLEEAGDESIPALERLKFISIFSSNLDEFFMVRVGSLFDLQKACPNDRDSRSGMTPAQQLSSIYGAIPALIDLKRRIYDGVYQALARQGVCDLAFADLTRGEQKLVKQYFKNNILPILSPIILGSHHPVPHLESKELYVAANLQDEQGETAIGLIPMPATVPPLLVLTGGDALRYIRTENIVLHWAGKLFGDYRVLECTIATVTRNADISFDDDKFEDVAFDFRNRVTSLLKSRDHLNIVRMELASQVSEEFLGRLSRLVHVDRRQVYLDTCPLQMRYVFALEDKLSSYMRARLLYAPHIPRWPEDIDPNCCMIDQIQQKDKLLFFPFDSTEPFLRLLTEAAENPEVVSIKITIYRLASSSKIARILCRAAENGKDVMVMMELRARFDEANNIQWSKMLESAGCQVIYGMEDFKCHSKVCQITLQSRGKLRYITQIGTGNYNEKTNTLYTDLSLMTASQEIGEEVRTFFQNLLVNNLHGEYHRLLVSPEGMERALCRMIDEEIKKGADGYVCAKINSLTDCEMIEKLVEASQAGVEVQLIVRGICCLLPSVVGYTENIHITSIVGRFLEHSRIYLFGRGEECRMYLSSADFMGRNLHHRLEIACPVDSPELKEKLWGIVQKQLADNAKASAVTFNGMYRRKKPNNSIKNNSQQQFMEESIHTLEHFTPRKKSFWERARGVLPLLWDTLRGRA